MARFCNNCGMPLPENANHCPGCGTPAAGPGATGGAASAQTGGLTENVAGLLAYVTIIPAIIFLVVEPYNRNRFIRFHAFQSIFFYVALFVLSCAVTFLGVMPFLRWVAFLLWPILYLAAFIVWLLTMLKAYAGQMWKLPMIGDMAEKQANAMP